MRTVGLDVLSLLHITFAARLMAFSLFLMLASETYCKWIFFFMSLATTQLFRSWYVICDGPVNDLISHVPVYKLFRFYDPSSEAQYETTRATLTLFGGCPGPWRLVAVLTYELLIVIVSILLLLTTFGVGLKCFSDFGKGLYEAKTSGQFVSRCLSFCWYICQFRH